VDGWIAEATAVLRAHGYPAAALDPADIATIIRYESAGNPRAVNNWDHNAAHGNSSMGLMQTVPGTFERYRLPGHHNILNPVDNIIAGVRYAVARYGSVSLVPGILSLARGRGYRGY
jgi:SLT domain-containing protein